MLVTLREATYPGFWGRRTSPIAVEATVCVLLHESGVNEVVENLVSAAGLEPATHALKGHCSTN
jgi:hypothetical protein